MKTFTNKKAETKTISIASEQLNSELLYIAENNKQFGSLVMVYSGENASMYSVEILSEYRGKGFGKKLVESAISHCKDKGFKTLTLNADKDNVAANGLYRSLGFTLSGELDGFNNYVKHI